MSRTSGTEQRRRLTPDEKATILRRHLVDTVETSPALLASNRRIRRTKRLFVSNCPRPNTRLQRTALGAAAEPER